MRLFDTNVQKLKYKVLKQVATLAFDERLETNLIDVPEMIIPGPEANMRCCIYKERAIVKERIRIVMGGNPKNKNEIEVLPIACDECPITQLNVSEACRGCIAHRCMDSCPVGAITITNHRALIDHEKCIMCGKCMKSCPYNAIQKFLRPCENACKVGAITMGEDKKAKIDNDKCIACGACVYQCPFGAVMDKSYIMDVIKMLKVSQNNTRYPVYAVVAPSISGQFRVKTGKVVAGIKKLGFFNVVEAALGADIVANQEAKELAERGFLASSCCPAFVRYIETQFPQMMEHVSSSLSPMAEIGKQIKNTYPGSKVVFIGPCTAKKAERKKETVKDYVDCVLTFEELQALFDSQEIDLFTLEEDVLDNASYFGRIFARSGGLSCAVGQALAEQKVSQEEFTLNPVACDGIEECKLALIKASRGMRENNFIEGMACTDGCIGGAACLTHGAKDRTAVDEYGKEAMEKTIKGAIKRLNI